MDILKLKDHLMDMIKEEQIKLGYCEESVRLYYPLSSLNMLFGSNASVAEMKDMLQEFVAATVDELGDTKISNKGDRFCFHFMPKASRYVHDNTEESGFLYDFISTIARHDISINDILDVFKGYSENIHFEKISGEDFDYLIYFEDGLPDQYRYCLTNEGHHIVYHRYTKEDYVNLFE